VCQRPPRTIEELARRLSDPDSVAVADLHRDAVLVAQPVVVPGDRYEVARLPTFVHCCRPRE
jgi:hypothetical protein